MSLNFQSSPKFCVNLCFFQVGTNAKSKEMALQTEPKLELREKTPCIYFMECESISIIVSLKAEYSESCPEHVALFQSWLEFMGWCQHHLLHPAGSLERLAGLCFPPTGCILVNDLFQILPCLPHRLTASESLARRKNSGLSCWANQSLKPEFWI